MDSIPKVKNISEKNKSLAQGHCFVLHIFSKTCLSINVLVFHNDAVHTQVTDEDTDFSFLVLVLQCHYKTFWKRARITKTLYSTCTGGTQHSFPAGLGPTLIKFNVSVATDFSGCGIRSLALNGGAVSAN